MVYGDAHKSLLRTIASQGVISYGNCMTIFKSLPDFKETSIDTAIKDINKEIRPFQQNIKIVIDELTSEQKLVFLCLGSDDATTSQNMFSAKELDYFRILIENIMTTENREILINRALNLADKVKPTLKKKDAEEILDTWCRIHYLDKNKYCYALGIRAIHEFERYLQNNMPHAIKNCSVCQKDVFRGTNCPACDESVHTRCLNAYLEKVKRWPCCSAVCDNAQMERPDSTTLTETQLLQTQSRNSSFEPMEVSQIGDETEAINTSVVGRKRKRISSD